MRNLLFLVFVFILFSCNNSHKAPSPKQISLIIGDPIDVGLKDVLLFPVGGNYNPKITEQENNDATSNNPNVSFSFKVNNETKFDRYSSSEYINSDEQDFDIRNLLFYNQKSGATYPLSKDTLHILSFAIHNEFKNPLIFFRIVKKDLNGDNKFDSKDAVMLFVSDLNGKNLTQVTPENEKFLDYFYYAQTNSILIKTAVDINKNNSFASYDETNFREMKLDSPKFGREIFSKGLKDSLKSLIR